VARAEYVTRALFSLQERCRAVSLPDRADAVAASREDLVRIALMTYVPDQAIFRRVEQVMQRDGELYRAEAGGKVAAATRY
jgi:hypothetical protein